MCFKNKVLKQFCTVQCNTSGWCRIPSCNTNSYLMSFWLYHSCYFILFYFIFSQFSCCPASKELQKLNVTRESHVKRGAIAKGWASSNARSFLSRAARSFLSRLASLAVIGELTRRPSSNELHIRLTGCVVYSRAVFTVIFCFLLHALLNLPLILIYSFWIKLQIMVTSSSSYSSTSQW